MNQLRLLLFSLLITWCINSPTLAQNITGLNLRWNYNEGLGEFHFCEDGNLIRLIYDSDTVYYGNWFMQNDSTIRVIYTSKKFTRNLGNDSFKTIEANIYLDTLYTSYFDFPEDIISRSNSCFLYNFSEHLNGVYYYASEKSLSPNQVEGFSLEKLHLVKNEIFARYGYNFKNKHEKKYLKHFKKEKWYRAKYNDVTPFLTPIEIGNLTIIDSIISTKSEL